MPLLFFDRNTLPRFLAMLVVACGLLPPVSPRAQVTLTETGFTVTDLGSSVGAKGIECSPGGIWGDYIYIADSAGNLVERIDLLNAVSLFATLATNSFPVGLAWGPGPGGNFGDFLYVSNFGTNTIEKINTSGTVFPFATLTQPGDAAFDPTGAYGNDLFVPTAFTGPIYRVDEFGVATVFSSVPSLYLKFGPGGAWGSGMYSTSETAVGIVTVDMAGVATNFATGFTNPEGFDWAFGTGFGGDMFASDVATSEIWRIQPSGTKTLWATVPGAADVAFCNGSLYVVGFHGGCYKITPDAPVPVAFTSVRAVETEGSVRVTWDVFADEDILGFVVYRADDPASDPSRRVAVSGLLEANRRDFVDAGVRPGSAYRYTVGVQLPDGREIVSSPSAVSLTRASLRMAQNYPNPFNPTTTIEYALPEAATVTLGVYDGKGRLVVRLDEGTRSAGTHVVGWDGRDARGEAVASGTYFYRLTVGNRTLTRKLVLLK